MFIDMEFFNNINAQRLIILVPELKTDRISRPMALIEYSAAFTRM